MKKFLTVLLALSVVFTYTVGTAFATISTNTVADEQAAMKEAVETFYADNFAFNQNGTLASVSGSATGIDTNLTKTVLDKTITKIISDYNVKISTASVNGTSLSDAWTTDLGANAENLGTVIGNYSAYVYTEAVSEAKAKATAAMDAVNTALYSDADAKAINALKLTLSNVVTGATNDYSGFTALVGAIDTFNTSVKNYTPVANQSAELEKYKNAALALVNDAADAFRDAEEVRLEGIIAATTSTAAQVADATAKLNNLNANIAAVVDLFTSRINAVSLDDYTLTDAKDQIDICLNGANYRFANATNFYGIVDLLGTTDLLVKYAEDYATEMKNRYDVATGLAKFNTSTVDEALADIVAKIKNLDSTVNTYAKIAVVLEATPTAAMEAAALVSYKAEAIKVITTTNDAGVTNTDKVNGTSLSALKGKYAKAEWAAKYRADIASIQDEYELKIKTASTKGDIIDLVKEAQAKMDAIALRITDADTVITQTLAVMKTLGYVGTGAVAPTSAATTPAAIGGTIEQYAKSKDVSGQYTAVLADAENQAAQVLYDAVLAEVNTNLTNAQIQAILQNNYAAALAKIDAMKTTAALKSDAAALAEKIAALPATVTLENKEQYIGVQKEVEAYDALPGTAPTDISNFALLNAYMTKLITLEKNAVVAQIKALPTTITVADKAAVEAARAAVDAYDEAYGDYDTAPYYYGYTTVSNINVLKTAEANLSNAMLVDAAKKIAELPATITLDDRAAVEAARAAYEMLNAEEKAQFSKALLEKLIAAETSLAKLDIKAVESLKIKTSTKLYKGSKIRVKWTVTGDTSAVTGYQVYKSKKAQSGYTFMGKTTKNYMDNKKNLKKGTRYYYKVRAYIDVDGVRYYSDWSNKGNRIYK